MRVIKYKIKRIATPDIDLINQFEIQIDMVPTFIDKLFSRHPTSKTMVGSCIHWTWKNGTPVSYLWAVWASRIVKMRVRKAAKLTYVNKTFKK